LIVIIIFVNYYDNNIDSKIKNLQKYSSKDYVLQKLGKPYQISECPKNLWWNNNFLGVDSKKECKSYVVYKGIFLKKWGLGFNENNKLISKYTYTSE